MPLFYVFALSEMIISCSDVILSRYSSVAISFVHRTILRHSSIGAILTVRKASHLNIKTKMFDVEVRVLIGWLVRSIHKSANQNACLEVKHFCFYVKVVFPSYGDYNSVY